MSIVMKNKNKEINVLMENKLEALEKNFSKERRKILRKNEQLLLAFFLRDELFRQQCKGAISQNIGNGEDGIE